MIKAIETRYKGYRFRSRLEARWAIFFDAMGIKWEYERQGYHTEYGPYLPDFYLPEVGVRGLGSSLVEVKPIKPTDIEEGKLREVADSLGIGAIILVGEVSNGWCLDHIQVAPFWDSDMTLMHCETCNTCKYEFSESSYLYCPKCGGRASEENEKLLLAITAARAARFEHGESP
jgi:hypothetical protein